MGRCATPTSSAPHLGYHCAVPNDTKCRRKSQPVRNITHSFFERGIVLDLTCVFPVRAYEPTTTFAGPCTGAQTSTIGSGANSPHGASIAANSPGHMSSSGGQATGRALVAPGESARFRNMRRVGPLPAASISRTADEGYRKGKPFLLHPEEQDPRQRKPPASGYGRYIGAQAATSRY